jgi:hypothetical protein
VQASDTPLGHAKQRYSIWQAPIAAFYQKGLYVDAVKNWRGAALGYMLLMTFFGTAFGLAPMTVECIKATHNQELPSYFNQVPQVTYQNGTVSIDKPCPYQIKDPKGGSVIAEFRCNETGQPKLSDSGANPPIIITKDFVYIEGSSSSGAETKSYELATLKTLCDKASFNGNDLMKAVQQFLTWLPLGVFAGYFPIVFIGHALQMMIYGALAMLICSNMGSGLTFGAGMRLAAIAITPNIVLQMVAGLLTAAIPGAHAWHLSNVVGFLSIPIAIAYVIIGSRAVQQAAAADIAPVAT